jgi:hypothetical protein
MTELERLLNDWRTDNRTRVANHIARLTPMGAAAFAAKFMCTLTDAETKDFHDYVNAIAP